MNESFKKSKTRIYRNVSIEKLMEYGDTNIIL